MRSTLCEDGKHRIIAKVVIPMGITEIATFAMAHPQFQDNENAMNDFEYLNKRQLFNVAKDTVALRGASLADAEVDVHRNWTARQIERATAHVTMLFPEVN